MPGMGGLCGPTAQPRFPEGYATVMTFEDGEVIMPSEGTDSAD